MRALALLLFATAGLACIPPYRPPTADSPHAIVKIRRVYETRQGTTLHERLLIEQHVALAESVLAAETEAPRIDAVLVHPRAAALEFKSVFLRPRLHG